MTEYKGFMFADLGMPSGRLWATGNAPGKYRYEEAREKFGDLLPKESAMTELLEECDVCYNGDGQKSVKITGPNGNSIILPLEGYELENKEIKTYSANEGYYWTRRKDKKKTNHSYALYLSAFLNEHRTYDTSLLLSVRPCLETRQ